MTLHRISLSTLLLAAICGLMMPGSHVSAQAPQRGTHAPPQIKMINEAIKATWADFEVRPSSPAEESTWCRRVFLDVIGRIPTTAELDEFIGNRSKAKRVELVQSLLHDEKYIEDYANHWSTVWTNLMIGRSGGNDRRSMVNRSGMQKYFRDSFARNKPYDKMVEELITATGSTKPGTEGFNGAANFLIDKVNEDKGALATSSVSRMFLGLQVQCTQCHDHPFNQWKQQKFWEFNAFFRQTRGLRRFVDGTNDIEFGELVDEDFAGEARDPSNALIYYEKRNGRLETAYPVFVNDTKIEISGYVDEVNRREELAKLMLADPFLDKMIVNRTWAQFMGYGFTRPIDDLGPHNPATHPELLEKLGEAFRKSSYDMKELIFWITLSTPYQLEAELNSHNEIDDPTVGETPKFSRFYLRQMTAEQLYQSMMTATGAKGSGSYEDQERQRRQWLQQFVVAFGTDEGDEATTFNGSIPQALMMFNGALTRQATDDKPGGFIDSVTKIGKRPEDRVHELFRTGLSRRANRGELKVAAQIRNAVGEKKMLQDMWWAVLNSNEFILQH